MPDITAPVRKQVKVVLSPAEAFALFTSGLSRWWPMATHSCFQEDAVRIEIEPHSGGRVIEHARDGRSSDWGKIVLWEPPHRFSMTWHPAGDPAAATHLEVAFAEEGPDETVITLLHSGWEVHGDKAAGMVEGYTQGWDGVLDLFVKAAQQAPQDAAPSS